MEIVYSAEKFDSTDIGKIKEISEKCGILFDTARLLYSRKIDTAEKAERFLHPSKANFTNPYLLDGIKDAVEKINSIKRLGGKILIFGDYDADGICATTVLHLALDEMHIENDFVIPEREEGYGLNLDIIERRNINNDIRLIITVDCGISDREKVEIIKKTGIDIIVTDHHEPPEDLPDCIRINPKIKGQRYPFDGLCGAGVAYKLAYALIGNKADEFLDFVALATVSDSMDLIEENRDIVCEGLKLFNRKLRPCFKYIIGEGNKKITSQTLAFSVAPRVNAGGRMGDANRALKLFSSKSEKDCFDYSVLLNEYNMQRQTECENIYKQAKAKVISENRISDNVLMVAESGWKAGFVGIVAARLVEEFGRPTIVFGEHDGFYKGSARSVDGINILDIIASAKDMLVAYGGHSQAAGVTVEKEKLEILRERLNRFVEKNLVIPTKKSYADWEIKEPFSLDFAREIERLEPFGTGNRKPCFAVSVNEVFSKPLKEGSIHYTFKTPFIEMLDFNGEKDVDILSLPITKKIIFESSLSEFKGREYLKGIVKKIFSENDYENASLYVLDKLFCNIIKNRGEKELKSGIPDLCGYGTMFVLNHLKDLAEIEDYTSLPLYLGTPEETDLSDCVVLAPEGIINGYKNVVYVGEPLYFPSGEYDTYVINRNFSSHITENLSVERQDFATVFNDIIGLLGKRFVNSPAFYYGNKDFVTSKSEQFVFALDVFMELGIFAVEKGVLVYRKEIKSALTNSDLYCKIYSMKGK